MSAADELLDHELEEQLTRLFAERGTLLQILRDADPAFRDGGASIDVLRRLVLYAAWGVDVSRWDERKVREYLAGRLDAANARPTRDGPDEGSTAPR